VILTEALAEEGAVGPCEIAVSVPVDRNAERIPRASWAGPSRRRSPARAIAYVPCTDVVLAVQQ